MNNTVSTHETLYATVPMKTVHVSSYAPGDDEEVYTSFEQAISTRLTMYGYRVRSTDAMLTRYYEQRQTEPIVREPLFFPTTSEQPVEIQGAMDYWNEEFNEVSSDVKREGRSTSGSNIKRNVLLICFAIMCTLAGFDLMGLLILHMR
ncbi:MAG TPA: hypothetical protein DHW02_16395 [Ktedonobacter sp.]|nr:hypothetical protein [Ktedonobacter sp.]